MITTLTYDDKSVLLTPGDMRFFEELYVDYKIQKNNNATRLQLTIHPKQKIKIQGLKIEIAHNFNANNRIFCNGFQSWSESREFSISDQIPSLNSLAKSRLQYPGDEHIEGIQRGKGHLHSWTYGFIRSGDKLNFIGSLSEQKAFTLIQYDTKKNNISIEKDCANLSLEHSFPILDIWMADGKEQWIFNEYFSLLNVSPPKAPPMTGWTSRYNDYTDISEEIILKNADAFAKKNAPIDVIQIDNGYQKAVGDWLEIKSTFPNGMRSLADAIKSKGFQAGIWMAPYVCDSQSNVFKTKKHWLIQNNKGQPLRAGYSPLWGGWFYALDFYNKEVQEYILSIFKIATKKWGFDLLKLDFLYAACLQPPPNKTRGQVMHDALDFIRRCVGNKKILACGVPLGTAFGMVDYCRIGAGIHLKWEHQLLKFMGHRERVSTISALRSVLSRWQLNGRAFHNDPDVVLLRDQKIKLNPTQQFTILLINTLTGNLVFTSDFIGDYSDEQWAEFQTIFKWKNAEIKSVELLLEDVYLIRFKQDGKPWIATCNLTNKKQTITIGKTIVDLESFESMVLKTN